MCKTPKMPKAPPPIKDGFFENAALQTTDGDAPVLDIGAGATARGQLQAGTKGKSSLNAETIAQRLAEILGKRTIATSGTERSRKADKKAKKEESY